MVLLVVLLVAEVPALQVMARVKQVALALEAKSY